MSVPYYINLAPNYDATLTPRWIAKRGLGIEGEVRHRSRWTDTRTRRGLPSRRPGLRRRVRTDRCREHPGRILAVRSVVPRHRSPRSLGGLVTAVDVTAVSDNDYFGDFALEEGVASRVALERRGEVEYRRGGLWLRDFWRRDSSAWNPGRSSYRRLPEIGVTYAGSLAGPLGWSMGATWASFDSPECRGDRGRYHLDPRLRLALNRPWGFAELSGGVRRTGYDLADAPVGIDPEPRRSVRIGVLDAGLFLERDVSLPSGAGTQTLEPRLYYLRQSYADQDDLPKFDATELTFLVSATVPGQPLRGSGPDRRCQPAVDGRRFPALGCDGRRSARGAARRFGPSRGSAGRAWPDTPAGSGPGGGVGGPARTGAGRLKAMAWDAGADELGELGTGLSYRRDARRIVNIAYRRRFPDIDQTDISLHWPVPELDDRISVFGRWNHDWRHGQTIESFAGLGYASCCLAVKLLWHRRMDAPRNLPVRRRPRTRA